MAYGQIIQPLTASVNYQPLKRNMKIVAICLSFAFLISVGNCMGQGKFSEFKGPGVQLEDSFLLTLQTQYDTSIVAGSENLGWGNAEYQILALRNGHWVGYKYILDETSPAILIGGSNKTIDSFSVEPGACDSVLRRLCTTSILKINSYDTVDCYVKNKYGYGFITISDANSLCVYFITHASSFKKEYYAPGFFEKYCPNKSRKQFLKFIDKIKSISGNKEKWY